MGIWGTVPVDWAPYRAVRQPSLGVPVGIPDVWGRLLDIRGRAADFRDRSAAFPRPSPGVSGRVIPGSGSSPPGSGRAIPCSGRAIPRSRSALPARATPPGPSVIAATLSGGECYQASIASGDPFAVAVSCVRRRMPTEAWSMPRAASAQKVCTKHARGLARSQTRTQDRRRDDIGLGCQVNRNIKVPVPSEVRAEFNEQFVRPSPTAGQKKRYVNAYEPATSRIPGREEGYRRRIRVDPGPKADHRACVGAPFKWGPRIGASGTHTAVALSAQWRRRNRSRQ